MFVLPRQKKLTDRQAGSTSIEVSSLDAVNGLQEGRITRIGGAVSEDGRGMEEERRECAVDDGAMTTSCGMAVPACQISAALMAGLL